ncbi:MAG: recombinase family protein [Lachnospiraceae bacterium]|nr:recombinase family protein [Lachnospiraceae bacterium]
MSKKVRTLLRVSSKQQLHDDDIPMQRAEAEEYIVKRSDWVFDKEYLEKAVSAYKNSVADREILQEILEDAKKQEFDILLTYMSDRIGRQEEYSFYVATLNQLGIEVWTIKDGQLKTEEHIDKLLNYIRFWQNEGESKKTSMRVRDAQKEMVLSGKFVGGKAPFGYKLIPSGEISNHGRLLKKLEVVERDAEIVKKMYYLAIYQGMGYEKIAKTLNAEGLPAITTNEWKASTIASILKNPIYMGYYALNRRVNQSGNNLSGLQRLDRREWVYSEKQIPELVIIEPQMWEKAQEIREARKAKINASKEASSRQYEEQYNVPFSTKGKLVLIGLTYCGYCGKRLKNGSYCNHWTIKSTGEKKVAFTGRYVCSDKCAIRNCYSQNYLEGIVFEIIEGYMKYLKSVDVTAELDKIQKRKKSSIEKELQAIKKETKKLREDIETLEEKIPEAIRGDYYFSAEKLSSLIKEKEQQLTELQQSEKEIQRKLQKTELAGSDLEKLITKIPNWKEEFRNADTATKQMLLSSLIDRIEVKDSDIKIKFKIRLEDFADFEADIRKENSVLKSIDSEVGSTPLIRGCRSLIINELVIKITGKTSYEIEYR